MTRRALALLALAGLAVAGCGGIPTDDSPTLIASDGVPTELSEKPTPTTVQLGEDEEAVELYLVLVGRGTEERLATCPVAIKRAATRAETAGNAIERLIALNPAESSSCAGFLINSVPPTLELLDAQLEEGILVLDFSNLDAVESASQRRAVAQIVFTATMLPGVAGVVFNNDGAATSVPVEAGTAEPGQVITRTDFPVLLGRRTTYDAPPASAVPVPPTEPPPTEPPPSEPPA